MTQPETPASSGTEVGELGRPIVPEGLRRAGTRAWMWVGISIFAVILVTFLGLGGLARAIGLESLHLF